jgi:hypothetical protein
MRCLYSAVKLRRLAARVSPESAGCWRARPPAQRRHSPSGVVPRRSSLTCPTW